MGRLIDADILKIRLYHNKETVLNDALVNCIDETPTAYDVEAVVAELVALNKDGLCKNVDRDKCSQRTSCLNCYEEKVREIVRNGEKE